MTSFNCKILFASFVERVETYEKYDSSSSLSIVRDSLSPLSLSLIECLSFVETGRNLTKISSHYCWDSFKLQQKTTIGKILVQNINSGKIVAFVPRMVTVI